MSKKILVIGGLGSLERELTKRNVPPDEILAATDGAAAIAKFKELSNEFPPVIIIAVDRIAEHQDRIEAAEAILKQNPKAHIYFCHPNNQEPKTKLDILKSKYQNGFIKYGPKENFLWWDEIVGPYKTAVPNTPTKLANDGKNATTSEEKKRTPPLLDFSKISPAATAAEGKTPKSAHPRWTPRDSARNDLSKTVAPPQPGALKKSEDRRKTPSILALPSPTVAPLAGSASTTYRSGVVTAKDSPLLAAASPPSASSSARTPVAAVAVLNPALAISTVLIISDSKENFSFIEMHVKKRMPHSQVWNFSRTQLHAQSSFKNTFDLILIDFDFSPSESHVKDMKFIEWHSHPIGHNFEFSYVIPCFTQNDDKHMQTCRSETCCASTAIDRAIREAAKAKPPVIVDNRILKVLVVSDSKEPTTAKVFAAHVKRKIDDAYETVEEKRMAEQADAKVKEIKHAEVEHCTREQFNEALANKGFNLVLLDMETIDESQAQVVLDCFDMFLKNNANRPVFFRAQIFDPDKDGYLETVLDYIVEYKEHYFPKQVNPTSAPATVQPAAAATSTGVAARYQVNEIADQPPPPRFSF